MKLAVNNILFRIAHCFTILALPACLLPASLFTGKHAFEIASVVIAVFFLLDSAIKKDWSWLKHRWVQLGLAFWAWQILSTLWAYDTMRALEGGLIWGRFFMMAVALAHWILPNDKQLQGFILYVIVGYLTFLSIDALIQFIIKIDIHGNDIDGGVRLTGPFNKPILGSAIVNFLFPVVFYALHAEMNLKKRILYMTLIALCIASVILSGERSALMLAAFGLFLTGIFSLFFNKMRTIILFSAAAVITVIAFTIATMFTKYSSDYVKDRQLDSIIETIQNFSDSPYGQIWHDAFLLISEHPLLGVGARNTRTYWCDMGNQVHFTQNCPLHPHNQYLEIFSEFGLIGFSMYVLMLFFIVREFVRTFPLWRQNPIMIGIAITIIIRFWPLMTQTSYLRSMSAFPMWFIIGWGLAMLAYSQRNAEKGVS